jgi:hypothetical protein
MAAAMKINIQKVWKQAAVSIYLEEKWRREETVSMKPMSQYPLSRKPSAQPSEEEARNGRNEND